MQYKQGTKLNRNGWFSFVLNNVVEYFISYQNTSNINYWKRKKRFLDDPEATKLWTFQIAVKWELFRIVPNFSMNNNLKTKLQIFLRIRLNVETCYEKQSISIHEIEGWDKGIKNDDAVDKVLFSKFYS